MAESADGLRFTAVGLALLVASAWLPWAISRLGDSDASPRLVDLTMVRWVFLACGICVAAGLWAQRLGRSTSGLRAVAVACAVVLTVVPILGLAAIELIAIWMSPDRLPTTFRRLALGVKPMPGIWLTGVGGALCLVGATGQGAAGGRVLRTLGRDLRDRCPLAWMGVALTGAVALLAAARYMSWVRIDSSLETWEIAGWAMPWIGLVSLVGALAALALGLLAMTRPSIGAGVALSGVGWAITFVAGMTIVAAVSTPTVQAPRWVADRLAALSEKAVELAGSSPVDVTIPVMPAKLTIGFSVGLGAMLAFASGLLIMACAWVVCQQAASRVRP